MLALVLLHLLYLTKISREISKCNYIQGVLPNIPNLLTVIHYRYNPSLASLFEAFYSISTAHLLQTNFASVTHPVYL